MCDTRVHVTSCGNVRAHVRTFGCIVSSSVSVRVDAVRLYTTVAIGLVCVCTACVVHVRMHRGSRLLSVCGSCWVRYAKCAQPQHTSANAMVCVAVSEQSGRGGGGTDVEHTGLAAGAQNMSIKIHKHKSHTKNIRAVLALAIADAKAQLAGARTSAGG